MKALTIIDAEVMIPKIQAEIRNSGDGRYIHRLHAILLMAKGYSNIEVSDMLGETSRTITNWINWFNADGFLGLHNIKGTGRKTRLNVEQMEQIDIALRNSPEEYGLHGLWDGKTLSSFIFQTWGINLGVRQCQRIFNKLNFRLRKPRSMIARSDSVKQAEYKKTSRAKS